MKKTNENEFSSFHIYRELNFINEKINNIYKKHVYFLSDIFERQDRLNCTQLLAFIYSNINKENFKIIAKPNFPFVQNIEVSKSKETNIMIYFEDNIYHYLIDRAKEHGRITYITKDAILRYNPEISRSIYFETTSPIKNELMDIISNKHNNKLPLNDTNKNKLLEEIERLNIALDKTGIFYDDLVNFIKYRKENDFIEKYKNYKEIILIMLICSPEKIREELMLSLKSQNIILIEKDIDSLINELKINKEDLNSLYKETYNDISDKVNIMEQDIIPSIKLLLLKHTLDEELLKKSDIIKKSKI